MLGPIRRVSGEFKPGKSSRRLSCSVSYSRHDDKAPGGSPNDPLFRSTPGCARDAAPPCVPGPGSRSTRRSRPVHHDERCRRTSAGEAGVARRLGGCRPDPASGLNGPDRAGLRGIIKRRNLRPPSVGSAPENQVRTGLPAGGNRIRTIGPAVKYRPLGRSASLSEWLGWRGAIGHTAGNQLGVPLHVLRGSGSGRWSSGSMRAARQLGSAKPARG